MAVSRPGPLLRAALRAPGLLYRVQLGGVLGHRFLLLVHRGRKSGLVHETVLEVVRYDPVRDESTVVSGWGRRSQWFRNIQAEPALEVRTAGRRFVPDQRVLDEDEAMEAIAGYERRNRLIEPIVRRVLSRLAGFPYDGTEDARRRLVRELPLVAFRPRDPDPKAIR